MSERPIIILAGASGNLGKLIARELAKKPITVKALLRPSSSFSSQDNLITSLKDQGIEPVFVDFSNHDSLTNACRNAQCVVSALSGMRSVIVDTQLNLLNAAVAANVKRFIPSDFSMEYLTLSPSSNRNLNWRREFNELLNQQSAIQKTSILCGPFMDVLTDLAPILFPKLGVVVYWGNDPHVALDFTTMQNVAEFTALVASDETDRVPRTLRISGSQTTPSEIAKLAGSKTGSLRVVNAGSLQTLEKITSVMRRVGSQTALYPAWIGMQYFHGMFSGLGKLHDLDNDRYPEIKWTTVKEILEARAG